MFNNATGCVPLDLFFFSLVLLYSEFFLFLNIFFSYFSIFEFEGKKLVGWLANLEGKARLFPFDVH